MVIFHSYVKLPDGTFLKSFLVLPKPSKVPPQRRQAPQALQAPKVWELVVPLHPGSVSRVDDPHLEIKSKYALVIERSYGTWAICSKFRLIYLFKMVISIDMFNKHEFEYVTSNLFHL